MNNFDLSLWHPGCSVDVLSAGGNLYCWCPKHRKLSLVQAVALITDNVSSFDEDPAKKPTLTHQPSKNIPGYDLWKARE